MTLKENISVISLFLLLMVSDCAVGSQYEKATREASSLLSEYIYSTHDDVKKTILSKLSYLSYNNPGNINVVRSYTGILSSVGEYKKAISVLESFNKRIKNTSLLLHECMLKDRVGDYEESCYRKVISLKKFNGVNDVDYLMALFMVGDNEFNKEKGIYKKGRDDNDDLNVFKNKKEDILKEFYPN
ncbi:hypothetical protein HGT70_06300 [Rosenbergiella collisarenosi]|uniref:hypothetical protein n=1 Tax=Rosenbergiella collisarenosi TaxID=1544695 RepID=UPI001BD9D166|nr:hypothetical protein [Rosenbergiella collisarenosi]MBT0720892.1 hypothetical protein [Rosenbergiella collisarenosi]